MSLKDILYDNAPLALQNAMISIYGYGWRKRRFGGVYADEYKNCKNRESNTKQDWEDYSSRQLRKILLHAFENVPYYTAKWKEIGLTAEKLNRITVSELSQIPFLEKNDLRQYCKTTLLAHQREADGQFFASSGTTGSPVSILFSNAMHQRWTAAFEARIRNWAGLNRFNSRGMIGGRRIIKQAVASPPYYRYNAFEKQVYFSAYHISEATTNDYLQGLLKYKPTYMTGYAVSNYILAGFFDKLKLEAPPLQAVITSSEKLTPEMRGMFLRVYDCKTYDSYSGVEACSLVSECEKGKLHISPDVGLIEFINEKGENAQPGEIAEMVCTGFLNYDQPLIRYRIGDYAVLDDSPCTCGREMPVVRDITGRTEDIVTGRDGRKMVRFHGLYINLPNIIQGQVIQKSYDDYILKIVSQNVLSTTEKETITQRMKSQLGNDVTVIIEEVKNIPVGANGKYKAVISEVN